MIVLVSDVPVFAAWVELGMPGQIAAMVMEVNISSVVMQETKAHLESEHVAAQGSFTVEGFGTSEFIIMARLRF